MFIGQKLRELRESKNLSQGDIEKRTGLFRCYTSRVEHGHTVPNIETLEKYARALEIPLYRLFYEEAEPPTVIPPFAKLREKEWGAKAAERRTVRRFVAALMRLNDWDRKVLLDLAGKMAARRHRTAT